MSVGSGLGALDAWEGGTWAVRLAGEAAWRPLLGTASLVASCWLPSNGGILPNLAVVVYSMHIIIYTYSTVSV